MKQVSSHAVDARQVTIQNAADMFAFCQRKLLVPVSESGCTHTRRSFVLVDTSDYASRSTVTANMLKTIPGTRSMHSVKPGVETTGLVISSRNFTCFCAGCKTAGVCSERQYMKDWCKHTIRKPVPVRSRSTTDIVDQISEETIVSDCNF